MQAIDDFSAINGPITPGKRQNIRLQVGSFVLCARHYDLETSVTFHNKVISRDARLDLLVILRMHTCGDRGRN